MTDTNKDAVGNTDTVRKGGALPSLGAAPCSGRGSDTRKIRVRCWVRAWGQEIDRIVEIASPPVSNMPCPEIQRKTDEALAEMAISFGVKTGFDILPNVEWSEPGDKGATSPGA